MEEDFESIDELLEDLEGGKKKMKPMVTKRSNQKYIPQRPAYSYTSICPDKRYRIEKAVKQN